MLILCVLAMASCSKNQTKKTSVALDISGAEISDNLFAFFLSDILQNKTKYSLSKDSSKNDIVNCATELCGEYVAVNSLFQEENLQLSSEYKYQITNNVSTKWDFYKNFYNSVGIDKQTVTKYETYEAKKEMLLLHFYGQDGKMAIPESVLKAYFNENYVTFKSINGYLTTVLDDGTVKRLGNDDISAIENKFKVMCDDLRTGTTIEDICAQNANNSYVASTGVDTVTINRFSNSYPTEFFNAVQAMTINTPKVIETSDNIFLVLKQGDPDGSIFENYRTECLTAVCSDTFSSLLKNTAASFKTDPDSSVINDVYKAISDKF